jgi:hypothetical protein
VLNAQSRRLISPTTQSRASGDFLARCLCRAKSRFPRAGIWPHHDGRGFLAPVAHISCLAVAFGLHYPLIAAPCRGTWTISPCGNGLPRIAAEILTPLDRWTRTLSFTFGRDALIGLFWVWGLFGLIGNLLSLNGQIGIEALSSQLLWIGGMLLFGLGALLIRPGPSK